MAATARARLPMTEHDGRVAWPACARVAWPACARNTISKPIGGKTPATLRLPAPSSVLKSRHPHPVEVRRRDPPGSDGLMAANATPRIVKGRCSWGGAPHRPNSTSPSGWAPWSGGTRDLLRQPGCAATAAATPRGGATVRRPGIKPRARGAIADSRGAARGVALSTRTHAPCAQRVTTMTATEGGPPGVSSRPQSTLWHRHRAHHSKSQGCTRRGAPAVSARC